MMMKYLWAAFAAASAYAQEIASPLPPEQMIAPEDKSVLDSQAKEIFREWDKVAVPVGQSVVALVAGNTQVALGTVVGKGKVLTKLSDLQKERRPVMLVDSSGRVYDAKVLFALPEHDLLMMDVPGLPAPPIDLDSYVQAKEGDVIAAVSPTGHVSDFGVVSVAQRSLRADDQPYLGIVSDPRWDGEGVMIGGVEAGSGAHRSGLTAGDVLMKLNGKPVDGMYSIRAAMVGVRPGETVPVEVRRRNQVIEGKLLTGSRPRVMKFPQKRLDMMNSMGNRMSLKRDEFPLVIQSDMTLFPERAGCPVIDVNGKFVGLALSRAGRTETYILPSWICRELVEGVLPQVQQYRAGRGENIPEAQPVDDSYDARRLEENRRKVEDKMSRQGLVPKVYSACPDAGRRQVNFFGKPHGFETSSSACRIGAAGNRADIVPAPEKCPEWFIPSIHGVRRRKIKKRAAMPVFLNHPDITPEQLPASRISEENLLVRGSRSRPFLENHQFRQNDGAAGGIRGNNHNHFSSRVGRQHHASVLHLDDFAVL